MDIPATVVGIEYDPNRTANIALICYADGEKAYILAPEGLESWHESYERSWRQKLDLVTACRCQKSRLVLWYTT